MLVLLQLLLLLEYCSDQLQKRHSDGTHATAAAEPAATTPAVGALAALAIAAPCVGQVALSRHY